MKPLLGLSIFPQLSFLNTCLSLFEQEKVEVLEWSFDHCHYENRPEWFNLLLKDYSEAGRLLAHGVHYSAFTAQMNELHDEWLALWEQEQQQLKYVHVSEHIGYKSQLKQNTGFPLPLDYHLVDVHDFGHQVMALQSASKIPLGFEILALSLSYQQVIEQAKFVTGLCQKFNTFIVLDLHNLYCQAFNFNLEIDALIALYPIEYIREIHISGGSFSYGDLADKQVRRDTHDGAIPKALFKVLQDWLPRFKHCQYIIFEQLPESLKTTQTQQQFISDYDQLMRIRDQFSVEALELPNKLLHVENHSLPTQVELSNNRETLFEEQYLLANALMQVKTPQDLQVMTFKYFNHQDWSLAMIETAIKLSQSWNSVNE
ncbi:multinuclear nonheme iron-dependent oxidase [Acinetobacter wuhouensis]|uniref:DUF692 family protein n=1 Tax=Acinetobacter wuhouensis TaxID=1879050 RepID=A0A3G2T2V7_9GAMM|nr:DUF692 family multinuclear iron-containing protein [Acinetobacter wuhouensis]AYO54603.1 DUF692 family protein [Acinetobacter wuhouensis]